MKKEIVTVLAAALLLSGCASGRMGNPGAVMAGAAIGGGLGSSIGGLIGSNNGWDGGYRGSAIGNIVGTVAGAALGGVLTAPRNDRHRDREMEDEVYRPQTRDVYDQPVVEAVAPSPLLLRNIRFIDDNRNQRIDAGETSKIIFEVINEGNRPAYNVVPIVETVRKVRRLRISPSVMVEEVLPGEGFRYTATVYAGEKLKSGDITFRVGVADERGKVCDVQEFVLPAQQK